ncbi:hypothetical protein Scep_019406 [Stephania cephalantha]|uniref:Uncharacterized protein n=1 Tax=Stephania cephalantha TaxID=152367 RepID=A0AAP0IB94_9MAGN
MVRVGDVRHQKGALGFPRGLWEDEVGDVGGGSGRDGAGGGWGSGEEAYIEGKKEGLLGAFGSKENGYLGWDEILVGVGEAERMLWGLGWGK